MHITYIYQMLFVEIIVYKFSEVIIFLRNDSQAIHDK